MQVKLTTQTLGEIKVEPANFMGAYGPTDLKSPGLSDSDIAQRILTTVGTPPLRELARGKRKILIVTDDNTRATPVSRLLPPVLDELKKAGVTEDQITFLIGLGTHRPMTDEEIRAKFGTDIAGRFQIINHEWDNPQALVSLGSCELGFEIVINRLATEADMILAVGSVVPHATVGFSGGGKTIMPGICGEKTIEDTHWKALDFPMAGILGNFDNSVRQAVVSVCRKTNLAAIINTVLFNDNEVYDLVVGDVDAAHRRVVDACLDVYGVRVPGKADIVIAEAYPTDIDLRQAIKAICSADIVCKDGGVIILAADCPEGVAPQFPDFAKYGFSDPDSLFLKVEEGIFPQKLMAYTLVAIGRIICKRVQAILISFGIAESTARQLGFLWAPDLQSALDKAYEKVGSRGKVIMLKQAGQILPLLS